MSSAIIPRIENINGSHAELLNITIVGLYIMELDMYPETLHIIRFNVPLDGYLSQ
jgi:hypothetical protein